MDMSLFRITLLPATFHTPTQNVIYKTVYRVPAEIVIVKLSNNVTKDFTTIFLFIEDFS